MKKRFICMLLVLVMAVTLLPMAALAKEEAKAEIVVAQGMYEKRTDKLGDFTDLFLLDIATVGKKSLTISDKEYDKLIYGEDGEKYDLIGIHTMKSTDKTPAKNAISSLNIPGFPQNDAKKQQEWIEQYGAIVLAYGPHEHVSVNGFWFFSLTNHWKKCALCREIYDMNWHHDKDTNDKCDECEISIHYYTVTVAETTGGKVTVSKEKAALNDTVDVTITPDSGYKVKSIAFYNDNEVHSQLTQYVDDPGKAYHFVILPWDAEVVVEFEAIEK